MQLVPIARTGMTSAPLPGAAEVVKQVIEATVALYERRGYQPPWIGYLAMEGQEVVGGCGFAGPPSTGEVEIAYFTFPGNEGRSIATRMAGKLLELTRAASARAGTRYIAHTLPQEGPSTAILKKLGFQLEGAVQHPEDGLVWKWIERAPSDAQPLAQGDPTSQVASARTLGFMKTPCGKNWGHNNGPERCRRRRCRTVLLFRHRVLDEPDDGHHNNAADTSACHVAKH